MRRLRWSPFAVLSLAVGCHGGPEPSVPQPPSGQAVTSAQRVDCPYEEPVGDFDLQKVTLAFKVLPNGAVEPSSIRVVPGHHDTTSQEYISRAKAIARRCVYRPATQEGKPVASTVEVRFAFGSGG